MKNSLKVILLCVAAGLGTLPALRADDTLPPPPPANPPSNGPGPGGGNRGEKMQERMIKELGLSADQQSKWQALDQQERDAVQTLRADTSLSRDDKRAKMQEIRKNFQGQRRAVLTPDQQTKFDEIIAKRREHRGGWNGQDGQNGPPPPPPPPPSDNK